MILLAFGSNLDGPCGTPEQAVSSCAAHVMPEFGIHVVKRSAIWMTAPVPVSDQPPYANAVAQVETNLMPEELMDALKRIEVRFGRKSAARNAARTLDLDILAYRGLRIQSDALAVPHPRLHERGFVLFPLREIAPHWRHPAMNLTVSEMIARLPADQILTAASRRVAA